VSNENPSDHQSDNEANGDVTTVGVSSPPAENCGRADAETSGRGRHCGHNLSPVIGQLTPGQQQTDGRRYSNVQYLMILYKLLYPVTYNYRCTH
jgi:hypothetical protein